MNTRDHIVNEFKLRVFDESIPRIEKCLALVSEGEIWQQLNGNIPSIGNLVLHLLGNARQWVISGIGTEDDIRNRDWEFLNHSELSKTDLLDMLTKLKSDLNRTLIAVNELQISKSYHIQDFNVSGFSVLVHVIEHFSYHTGQISTQIKLLKNCDLGYYDEHDL